MKPAFLGLKMAKNSKRTASKKRKTRTMSSPIYNIADPLWTEVYKLAIQFKESKCWKWLYDSDIMYYRDQKTGYFGLMSIMGFLGEFIGIAFYYDEVGMKSYFNLEYSECTIKSVEACDIALDQQYLLLKFGDRRDTRPQERELFSILNLKFRGSGNYLLFRKKLPGTALWYLNKQELEIMKRVLETTLIFIAFLENNPEIIKEMRSQPNRIPDISNIGRNNPTQYNWFDLTGFHFTRTLENTFPNNLALESYEQLQAGWIIEEFYIPSAIKDKNDIIPYYFKIVLIMDAQSGIILETLTGKSENIVKLIKKCIKKVSHSGHRTPSVIYSSRESVLQILTPWAKSKDVVLVKIDESLISEFRESLFQWMT